MESSTSEKVFNIFLMEHLIPHYAQEKAVEAAVSDSQHYLHGRGGSLRD